MTSIEEREELIGKTLNALGSPGQIRDLFAAEKCYGVPSMPLACPVSNWVYRQTGERIAFSGSRWRLQERPQAVWESYRLAPAPVRRFACCFDAGLYPELEVSE